MKKLSIILFVTVFIVSTLIFGVSCKKGTTAEGTTAEGTTAEGTTAKVTTAEVTTAEEVTIKFWKYQDENEQETLEALVAKFNEENEDINVVFETFPWEQYTGEKLITAMAGGEGPDVFWLSAGDFLKFVMNGLLLPLNDTFTEELQADFLEQSLKAVTIGESIYGVPHEMGVQSLVYDKKLFEQEGLNPPGDWDELIQVAQELKTDTRWGITLPTDPGVFENFIWYPWLWMAGGEVVDSSWTEATINESGGVQALQLWGDLVNKYKVAPPKGGTAFADDIATGHSAMAMLGEWVVDNFKANYPDFEIGVAQLPPPIKDGKSIVAYGGWWSVVNSQTKYPEAAKKFAVWLFGEDPQNCIDLLTPPGTYLSPRKSVMEQIVNTDYYKEYPHPLYIEEIWPNTRPEPAYPAEIVTAVTEAIQEVLFGGSTGQEAADKAAEKINSYLSGPDGDKLRELLK
jgi:multiple sugar transport system substrate-binding protein